MVDVRISQDVAEILSDGANGANAKARQLVAEVFYMPTNPANARVTQEVAEVIGDSNAPRALVSQEVAGTLADNHATRALVSQVVAQVFASFLELSPNVKWYIPLSDYLFPTLPGLQWNSVKRPKFSTAIAPHLSGREIRAQAYQYPIWEFDLSYEMLRADANVEFQTLIGFFLSRGGAYDTFLYKDPTESNVITLGSVATGDGVTTKFTLMKSLGGFAEPCGYVDPATLSVYVDAVLQTTGYSLVSPNQVVFVMAPAVGKVITATYTWYYRVRFRDDSQDYGNFMYLLWENKQVNLESVKP